ncbi:unnamed protein product [Symbiodinium necroappetens]|uniref:Uncharacterized protein n=1 Tax=Symbiodinium necroappetens TaxID=1628268 RepID=A0A813A600_9DINO|nr:unnamed protein product [Symbiodinium necroappetens]
MVQAKIWGNGSVEEQYKIAFDEFDAWAKANKIPHSQPNFKISPNQGYPVLQCKAYNGRVVVAWAASKAVESVQTGEQELLAAALCIGLK